MLQTLLTIFTTVRATVIALENRLEFDRRGSFTFSGVTRNYDLKGSFVSVLPEGVTTHLPTVNDMELWFLGLLMEPSSESFAVELSPGNYYLVVASVG